MNEEKKGPQFRGGSLSDCEIRESVLRDASFEGVSMYGADFSHSDLSGSTFYLVLALGAIFRGADLRRVQFFGGSYQDADFQGADLRGAIFSEDNMGGFVDLSGADLSDARLDGATFVASRYSKATKFPMGFSLASSGLELLDE